jgi:hypothetical protein
MTWTTILLVVAGLAALYYLVTQTSLFVSSPAAAIAGAGQTAQQALNANTLFPTF